VTLDRDELALKAALDRRRPAGLPPGLVERLNTIPDEVAPLRSLPMRLTLGIAPWAAVAAAALILVFPRATLPVDDASAPASGLWDPATTGGTASTGIFVIPWVPVLLWIIVIGAIATVRHVRRGGAIRGPRAWGRWLRPYLHWRAPRTSWTGRIMFLLLFWVPWIAVRLVGNWDPLSAADPFAPGPTVAEVLRDGLWHDDSIEHASSYGWGPGEPCLAECPGPRYLYRVQPGERYWWLETIRNDGPLPVTLLGRRATDIQPSPIGLGLLRDPSVLSADPANLRPFEPVVLGPGATVTVAVVQEADACADPAGSSAWGRYAMGSPFVYDVLGWRRVGHVYRHFSVTEAGCD
jgi:hypothetical protein